MTPATARARLSITVGEEDLDAIAAKSFRNCHAIGVDSILFDDTPGDRLRAFVANKEHTLYANCRRTEGPLSVALHPHHCDVKLIPIFGEIYNVTPKRTTGGRKFSGYRYQSKVTSGVGKFVRIDDVMMVALEAERLRKPLAMSASRVHTIFIPRGQTAAWYVREGQEDQHYSGLCWSDDDLEKFDFGPFYRPMDRQYLVKTLKAMGVKIDRCDRRAALRAIERIGR